MFVWWKSFREGRERVENKPHGRRTTTPSSRLFGSGYAANHKPFLKRASGFFQNVGKNVLTPEGSALKTDMYKGQNQKERTQHKWSYLTQSYLWYFVYHLIFSIFGIKLHMFRIVFLSIIRSLSLYTQQWYMSYSLRAGSGR